MHAIPCERPGAAAARNKGVSLAKGTWLLFLDSDCLPTPALIDGYQQALHGAVAYAGIVRATHHDPFSRYYETQGILSPSALLEQGRECPSYLITANCLVWRLAFEQTGGFNEQYQQAGGKISILPCACVPLDHSGMLPPLWCYIPSRPMCVPSGSALYATGVEIACSASSIRQILLRTPFRLACPRCAIRYWLASNMWLSGGDITGRIRKNLGFSRSARPAGAPHCCIPDRGATEEGRE